MSTPSPAPTERRCARCRRLFAPASTGRPPRYCSQSCRQQAYVDRKVSRAVAAAVARDRVERAQAEAAAKERAARALRPPLRPVIDETRAVIDETPRPGRPAPPPARPAPATSTRTTPPTAPPPVPPAPVPPPAAPAPVPWYAYWIGRRPGSPPRREP